MTLNNYTTSRTRGLFITFEGPEGSGKTTQIKRLVSSLQKAGKEVVTTREPGGTSAGAHIRQILLDPAGERLEPMTEIFLMLAQRHEHLQKLINPTRMAGKIVICDRYFDSSMAYQGYGRGLAPEQIRSLHDQFLGDYLPDLTVLLDIDVRRGLERAGKTGTFDRMESEAADFHQRVRQGYLAMARNEPARFLVLDATKGPDEVFDLLLQYFRNNAYHELTV